MSFPRPPGTRRVRRRPTALLAGGALLATAALAGCGATTVTGDGSGGNGFAGAELAQPVAMPAMTLTDTAGRPYDLRAQTRGLLTVLYFGYTHCPDICPTTMADLGAAIRKLPAAQAKQVQVVFVTSDPARDTPAVLGRWLANFDTGVPRPFVGLTGKLATIDADAKSVGVPLEAPVTEKDGTVEVTHGAQTLAFSPQDQRSHLVWLPGQSVAGYDRDLSRLQRGEV